MGWTTPICLTASEPGGDDPFSGDDDFGSLPTGDICYLGNDLVVVVCFSYDSYAVRTWAIDVSGAGQPDVGPVGIFNSENNAWWMTHPIPDDPRGLAYYPSTWCVATSETTFAVTGPAYNTYNASGFRDDSGSYIHAASFFEVNPTTKVITRTAFVVVDYLTLGPPPYGAWLDDHCMTAWGENVVITEFGEDYVLVVEPNGTCTQYTLPGYPGANYPVAPSVVGDTLVFLATSSASTTDSILVSMDLNTGMLTTGPILVGSTDYLSNFFSTPVPTGDIAFLTSFGHAGTQGGLAVTIVDPATLTYTGPTTIVPEGVRMYGWTSGYLANVQSITPSAGGRTLVTGVGQFTRTVFAAPVTVSGAPGTIVDVPLPNAGYLAQFARSVAIDDTRYAVVWTRQSSGTEDDYTYGPNLIVYQGEDAPPAPSTRTVADAKFWSPR